jgi:hypothetical protein
LLTINCDKVYSFTYYFILYHKHTHVLCLLLRLLMLTLDDHLQILDTNPQLYFHLQQQKLIELIRAGKINEALEFAQEELAPRGEENVIF